MVVSHFEFYPADNADFTDMEFISAHYQRNQREINFETEALPKTSACKNFNAKKANYVL